MNSGMKLNYTNGCWLYHDECINEGGIYDTSIGKNKYMEMKLNIKILLPPFELIE